MPEIDAEHRNQLAEAVRVEVFFGGLPEDGDEIRRITDALAPLVAGWLADAWDEGKDAFGTALAQPLGENGMRTFPPNPYRGGDDG